jgi:predicted phosphoribosyltransferase
MYFVDRYDAAMQLAVHLEKYKNEDGVIRHWRGWPGR